MKFTKVKKFIIFPMVLLFILSLSVPNAFADNLNNDYINKIIISETENILYQDKDITIVEVNSTNGFPEKGINSKTMTYGSTWVNSSDSGSFSINTEKSGTIGITIKAESSSDSSWAYMSVMKPDGTYFKNNVYIDPTSGNGDGKKFKIYYASSGTYTINYIAYTDVGMRLMCWMY